MRPNAPLRFRALSAPLTGLVLLAGCLPEPDENTPPADTHDADTSSTGGEVDGHDETGGTDEPGDPTDTPDATCDAGCADDELCHDGACHPAGFSIAIGGGTDRQTIWDVATDDAGNIAVVGDFANNLTLGGQPYPSQGTGRDVFVALFDPIGEVAWVRTFGSAEVVHQAGKGIAFDPSGDLVVVGEMRDAVDFGTGPIASAGQTDVFVVKLDRSGETLWARTFGGDSFQRVTGVAVDTDGSIALGGDSNGTFDLGGPSLDNPFGTPSLYVGKLDPDGEHLWSMTTGDGQNQHVRGIALDAEGHVVICGEFRGTIDLGAGPLTGNLFDVFVARFRPDGLLDWALANSDGGDEYCGGVAVDPSGNIGIEGRFEGPLSFGDDDPGIDSMNFRAEKFAAVFDPSGRLSWSRTFGVGDNETGPDRGSVAFDSLGNMILAGGSHVRMDFGGGVLEPSSTSVYLAKLDPTGAHVRSDMWGSQDRQLALAVAVDNADRIVMGGEFTGTIDFGFGPHSVQANMDAFLTRIVP